MNKREKMIVMVLFVLLIAWSFLSPRPGPPTTVPPAVDTSLTNETVAADDAPARYLSPDPSAGPPEAVPEAPTVISGTATPAPVAAAPTVPELPESQRILENQDMTLAITSHGGGVRRAELHGYAASLDNPDERLSMDFDAPPALAIHGLPGLEPHNSFDLSDTRGDATVTATRTTPSGLLFERRIELKDQYRIVVSDRYANLTEQAIIVPTHSIELGRMRLQSLGKARAGIIYLGIDSLASHGGEKVRHWHKKRFFSNDITLADLFQEKQRRGVGCVRSMMMPKLAQPLPSAIRDRQRQPTDWIASKNKFFVQILAAPESASGREIIARRAQPPNGEDPNQPRSWMQSAVIDEVGGALLIAETVLTPSQEITRRYDYYIGPKSQNRLKTMGNHQEDVMEFGKLKVICEPLLWTLNFLYGLVPNYGVAIILLTLIVKAIFWPITHKGTEHMKKMAEIQPLVKEVQAKYKDKPKKMQEESMALYKKHKVNPMAGCLPMVIQIPVFIGLFTVLRSAVELRFGGFLWIRDLSEPEGLLQGVLPIALNILPLFMTLLTVLQQRMTPTAGDPQQQKIMMFMPVVFLFLFYSMASGLVLYWSVSQLISVVQMYLQRRKTQAAQATAG